MPEEVFLLKPIASRRDLDFTITDRTHLNSDFLVERFGQIGQWIYDATGIEMPTELLQFDVWDTPHGSRAGNGRISYRGPLVRGGDLPRIRLDLTADEVLVREPVMRPVGHPYTDAPSEGIEARCYAFDEVFEDHGRSLSVRARAMSMMSSTCFEMASLPQQRPRFAKLCNANARSRQFPSQHWRVSVHSARNSWVNGRTCWDTNSLRFRPFNRFWTRSRNSSNGSWASRGQYSPPFTLFLATRRRFEHRQWDRRSGEANAPAIETIRFAAANRLCVDLEYRDEQGRHSNRVIEPYSLRRTQVGDILLMAVRADSGEARSYRLDRIVSARATQRAFAPRYPVELTPTGPLAIPDKETRSSGSGGFNGGGFRPPVLALELVEPGQLMCFAAQFSAGRNEEDL